MKQLLEEESIYSVKINFIRKTDGFVESGVAVLNEILNLLYEN